MLGVAIEKRIQLFILIALVGMTLVVTPWMNLDPINLPKLFLLVLCSFIVAGFFGHLYKALLRSFYKPLMMGILVFWAFLLVTWAMGESGLVAGLYGAYGRNTGLLAYFALSVLLLASAVVMRSAFAERVIWALVTTGFANAIYGALQWQGLDPVEWQTTDRSILGTLGNPNFISAHLGISSVAALALFLDRKCGLFARVFLFIHIGISLSVIYLSTSIQGIAVFAIGSVVVIYYRFVSPSRFSFLKYSYLLASVVGGVFGVMGLLQKGPLKPFLYQESVTFRGDYWRAGWNMTIDNPIFGVGLDSYGDWYRFYRSEEATLRRGPEITSNSAHNVFLDISSNGGFLLLGAYLFIFGLVIRSVVRIVRQMKDFDAIAIALITSWIAYVVQSTISINQLGLAIWGWVLGGAIIGYDYMSNNKDEGVSNRKSDKKLEQVPASTVITGTLGAVLGILIVIWPVAQDVAFRSALETLEPTKIEKAALRFPHNPYYTNFAAKLFFDNKLDEKATAMARETIGQNPRDFYGWNLLLSSEKLSESERGSVLATMKELDPFNNTVGK